MASTCFPALAEPNIPTFWDTRERLAKPDLAELSRLRFLTTTDFPPFNYLDSGGRLSGFHVDLARAVCAELGIADKCQIQALPWNELEPALAKREGEAIIAGLATTPEARKRLLFSRPYLRFTARFVTTNAKALNEPLFASVKGKRVGVVAGSAHERLLRDVFGNVQEVTFKDEKALLADLKAGKLDAAFGDGMRLAFWLAGPEAANCCRFSGGPYLAPDYLGTGLMLAAAPGNEKLIAAFDAALQQISAKGVFSELYLRYFPLSFY
ncbi:transporter substrate-binding domain-containing protein [Pseudaminobacter sp. 19-2017]|uniref:Transporter substrate-binding domain-containing protein n=1 Tax=Pseudaminobacter soli (ex Zhang et al. 2022) TaxID=2831468 RepID=A0A942DWQ1_9HYPH|nr:transporter substrate-binding domain-containing protein [Pseudaminobacter soli]MBS3648571.1 transporter substrate-binding domain-containing protein [Pseudaminobacter soli]